MELPLLQISLSIQAEMVSGPDAEWALIFRRSNITSSGVMSRLGGRAAGMLGATYIGRMGDLGIKAGCKRKSWTSRLKLLRFKGKKKRQRSLGTALTTYHGHSTRTILQRFSSTPMLILSAIRHFVRTLFIACTPLAARPEAQLSTCLHTCMAYRERRRRQLPRSVI